MKTQSSTLVPDVWRTTSNLKPRQDRKQSSSLMKARNLPADQRDLVESVEYEWTTPLNLPGLIVSPSAIEPPIPRPWPSIRHPVDEILETEDGDATSICQLPGGLGTGPAPAMIGAPTAKPRDELEEADEYTDLAAMQMPGGLVEPRPGAMELEGNREHRGLCASCVNRESCDFPRPAGGVWRCEEYA